ncbi:hypothetical protein [uncultured Methylobacterium sp.]|mgnify:CR=1 FL=1|jgi:hypothetical protein|uniref:hypothetical protein n=1 Tax=uncultured Methylobacterium sp. TaxID=157278 RepID=UPI00261D67F0|nr:hypothetical protein [uncultured Methylobacterium sp.]
MDLSPLFQSAERIAVALERIAEAMPAPVIVSQSPIPAAGWAAGAADLEGLLAKFGTTLTDVPMAEVIEHEPLPLIETAPPPRQETNVEIRIRALHAGGTTSYNAVARELNRLGLMSRTGKPFHAPGVKQVMLGMGLQSAYPYKGSATRVSRKADSSDTDVSPAPEPEPEPAAEAVVVAPIAPTQTFVERPAPPPKPDPTNLRDMLGAQTRSRLEAFDQARRVGRSLTDAELIAAALAEGRVTRHPACVDSTGYNHLTGEQS